MALSREELEHLMRLVGNTREQEITCEECLMRVSEFAEHELKGRSLSDALRAVEQHLAICGECREEYALLRKALSELDEDENGQTAPRLQHLVEAAIYADDLEGAERFYDDVLGLDVLAREPGRHVFFRVGDSVLLIFRPDETLKGGLLPPHGAKGPGHFALGIPTESLGRWKKHLERHGVEIEKEVEWPKGGKSLYFRDPAGNLVELVTRGLWGLPSGW